LRAVIFTVANTRDLSKAKRRPRKVQRPTTRHVTPAMPIAQVDLTINTIMSTCLMINNAWMIIKETIVKSHAMNTRAISITMAGHDLS
jgi:hypothetical protein